MLGWLGKLLLGDGTLPPELRGKLEAEGLVLLEEGLMGSIRYTRFKAPGKRFNGKVTGECFAVGVSEARLAVYCRSGKAELIDSPFSEPDLAKLDVSVEGDSRLILDVDYDKIEVPNVSGRISIRARTPKAALIAEEVRARIGR